MADLSRFFVFVVVVIQGFWIFSPSESSSTKMLLFPNYDPLPYDTIYILWPVIFFPTMTRLRFQTFAMRFLWVKALLPNSDCLWAALSVIGMFFPSCFCAPSPLSSTSSPSPYFFARKKENFHPRRKFCGQHLCQYFLPGGIFIWYSFIFPIH